MGAASRGLVSRYTQISNINIVFASLVALSACVLPSILSDYWIFQCTMVMVYSIALLGLNLLTGYNGQISLGHGAFYAIGAYATAILAERMGVPYVVAIIFSAGICLVVGYLFGLPALRLEGLYLALATFALALAVPQLLRYKGIEDWTGGSGGLLVTKPAPPTWVNLDSDRWLYFVTLGFLIIAFLAVRNLLIGPMGRAIVAIRDNPLAAEALGVDAARTKSVTFGISACLAGLAGSLGALAVQYVAPDTYFPDWNRRGRACVDIGRYFRRHIRRVSSRYRRSTFEISLCRDLWGGSNCDRVFDANRSRWRAGWIKKMAPEVTGILTL
jgi:ABC-type branched-subunit amino acid transport system permease subunit